MKIETLDLWYKHNDVHDFLHTHKLSCKSLIVDVGSYKGNWLHQMNSKYGCKCIGVEPIPVYFNESLLLKYNNQCDIHNYGLTVGGSGKTEISLDEDGSSMIKDFKDKERLIVSVTNAKEFFEKIEEPIDVLQINTEGLEYSLIPYMSKHNLFQNVKFIQIQFHDINSNSENEMNSCINIIKNNGFIPKYNYPFVWYGAEKV